MADRTDAMVEQALRGTAVIDIHTHLFAPRFGALGLWGIDNLLTYHYLEAELFRFSPIEPAAYRALPLQQRADLVWKTLFVDNTPVSESVRGVVAVLHALGLDTAAPTLDPLRAFFREQRLEEYVPRVFDLAGIQSVVMTNDPWDPAEAPFWNGDVPGGDRFLAALRLDRILNDPSTRYTITQTRQMIEGWVDRMRPVYMAVSLPDSFAFPHEDLRTGLLKGAVLPACRERALPLALMIGVRRQVNPELGLAGDGSGVADLTCLENLCREFPENKFLVTVLARENQHELCVYARKFRNLMPFGCWWFVNNPSMVEEITRERLEMLGTSFIPQHSDARVLEQVIYKWRNTRRTLAPILAERYRLLAEDGREVTQQEIERDVARLFRGNFESFTGQSGIARDQLAGTIST
jgi:hypothetical protein